MRKLLLLACLTLAACLPFNSATIPRDFSNGSSTANIVPAGYARSDVDDPTAAVRIFCRPTDQLMIDPFKPRVDGEAQPSHLHTFFGNTGVGLESDLGSIATTGGSTCDGGTLNRTGYWVPTMLFPAPGQTTTSWRPFRNPLSVVTSFHHLDGAPVWQYDPDGRSNANLAMNVYYKSGYDGVLAGDVDQWIPPGLGMIAGNPDADAPGENPNVWYGCAALSNTGPVNGGPSIPDCAVGTMMVMVVEFPQCWDGVHMGDEPGVNYRTHMAYGLGWPDRGCPASHPVALPQVTELIHTVVTAQNAPSSAWHLSSDMYAMDNLSLPGGYSGHADFSSGWDRAVGERLLNWCYRGATNGAGWDCHGPLLGPNPNTGQLEMLADNQ